MQPTQEPIFESPGNYLEHILHRVRKGNPV